MVKNYFFVGISSWMIVSSSWAGEFVQKTCRSSLINLLHQYESKTGESLDVFEFRHNVDTRKIFDTENLKISPVPIMREIFGIYRRPMVARGARSLFNDVKLVGNLEGQELVSLLKPNTYYTYVVDDEKIVFAQTRPGKIRDYGSKHAILWDQTKDLHLAGEFYVDGKGVFHFDGASGTFQTPNIVTQKGLKFFRDELGIANAEVHLFGPPIPTPRVKEETTRPVGASRVRMLTMVTGRELSALNNDTASLEVQEGTDRVKYELKLAESSVTREFIYDTEQFDLRKRKLELRSTTQLLDENKEAVQLAHRKINSVSPFYVQASEEIFVKEYVGHSPKGHFLIRVEARKVQGGSGDISGNQKHSSLKYVLLGEDHVVQGLKIALEEMK